ncbi:MAG: serine hydrolase domain-containing protein, partial [Bacteroidota bacterium]
ANQQLYSPQTVQYLGSISKPVIGMALMFAVQEGLLRLDQPINEYLPFEVIHPFFPETPITLWHLATHTSGMVDTKEYGRSYLPVEQIALHKKELHPHYYYRANRQQGNLPMSMADFLQAQYVKGGKWYKKKHFLKEPPGEQYEYSNAGAALAALVIEEVSGESYADFVKNRVFQPLGLTDTYWELTQVPEAKYATPYWYDQTPFPRYTLITYPDGGLLTSVADMARLTQEWMRGYHGESELLPQSAFEEMLKVQFEGGDRPGLFWDHTDAGWVAHGGGDPGTYTLVMFHPEKNLGKIFFTNIFADFSDEQKAQFREIWVLMSEYQDRMLAE